MRYQFPQALLGCSAMILFGLSAVPAGAQGVNAEPTTPPAPVAQSSRGRADPREVSAYYRGYRDALRDIARVGQWPAGQRFAERERSRGRASSGSASGATGVDASGSAPVAQGSASARPAPMSQVFGQGPSDRPR